MNGRKMRLLFLTPFPPRLDAEHGGARVIAQLIAKLAMRHHIALLSLRAPAELPVDSMLRDRCDLVEEILRPAPGFTLQQVWARLASLVRGAPLWIAGSAVPAYTDRVRTAMNTFTPDIVQLEYHVMGQYLSALRGWPTPRVLTQHEPGTEAARDLRDSQHGFRRCIHQIDCLSWLRYERKVLNQVHAVVVFTDRDQQITAKKTPHTQIVRIPFGTNVREHPLNPVGTEPRSLVFVGNFLHPPNVDAATRLVRTIFPLVLASSPEAVLYIVGHQPPRRVREMAGRNVVVTGSV